LYFFEGKSFVHIPVPESEDVIEKAIIENQEIIFPDFVVVNIKMEGRYGNYRTLNDLILVSKTCDQWFIVEVERKNDTRYVRDHIHEQLAMQTNASWDRVIPKVRQDLIRNHGFSADEVLHLGDEDPGFYLFIPESTEIINQICSDFNVRILETKIWMNQKQEYALEITNPDMLPKAWNQDLIELDTTKWNRVLKKIEFQFPSRIKNLIEEWGSAIMYIDDTAYVVSLNFHQKIEVPLSDSKNSDTHGLAISKRWNANFRLDIDHNDQKLYLHFERNDWY
tara:strand:- start:734 stop:1573 length:840 start_codon:yes stop_codon:yes gene_type:complete